MRIDPNNLMWVMPTKGDLLMSSTQPSSQPSVDSSNERVLSTPAVGLLWFGAAVSLAEVLTGTFFAPLGFEQGIYAILLGHAIGCVLFFLISYISAVRGVGAMDAIKLSFGRFGSIVFSVANVIQLVGWTAIMIASGALAAAALVPVIGYAGWAVIIGVLIVLWIALGVKRMSVLQGAAAIVLALFLLVASATALLAPGALSNVSSGELSFGAAVELAVAMPLSWLPVAGDYLRSARHPLRASIVASVCYALGSSWMYIMGLILQLSTGAEDPSAIIASSLGLVIAVLSTVTTTFLDAQSAGVSAHAIDARIPERAVGVIAAILGVAAAILFSVFEFEDFLYLIGSVFAPMVAIVCVDFYLMKRDQSQRGFDVVALIVWVAGFVLYRISMSWDFVLGNTCIVMIITAVIYAIIRAVFTRKEA